MSHEPLKLAGGLLLSLIAVGCAGGLHSDAPPVQIYTLRAVPAAAGSAHAGSSTATLRVARPTADPGLGTERIMLVQSDRRMSYYAGSSWPAELPEVVEALAVDTLHAWGGWAAVNDASGQFASDYLLQITIRRFEADYTGAGPAPKVHVSLDCSVARRDTRELLASFIVEGSAEAHENHLSAVVAAFEAAANTALTAMAERTAAAADVKTSTSPSPP